MIEPGYQVLRRHAKGPFVIFCDHASNHIPAELENLGLPNAELSRHIAWDIGAAGISQELSQRFDSPAILCGTSRLVIDCNRQLSASDLIPEVSDGTIIPGNRNLSAQARELRIRNYFTPYHDAIESVLPERLEQGMATIAVSVHSMTDKLAENLRPWQIALSSHVDRSLVEPMLEALRRSGDLNVGDNEPYDLDPAVDYTTPFHAIRRGLPHLQVEFRQDLIKDVEGQQYWARRFGDALQNGVISLRG